MRTLAPAERRAFRAKAHRLNPVVTIDQLPAQPAQPAKAKSLRELEKEGILAALAATGGNKAQAAAILEIDRSTLYKKLKDYDIES